MRRYKVVNSARCAMCPPEKGPQVCALWENGLALCSTHEREIRSNHKALTRQVKVFAHVDE